MINHSDNSEVFLNTYIDNDIQFRMFNLRSCGMTNEQSNLVKQYISDEFITKDIKAVEEYISELNEKLKPVCEITIKKDVYSVDIALFMLTINVYDADFFLPRAVVNETPLLFLLMRKFDDVLTKRIDLMTFVVIYTNVGAPEIVYFYRPEDITPVSDEDKDCEFIHTDSTPVFDLIEIEMYQLDKYRYFKTDGYNKLLKIKKGV